jgi:hypothetical protein
MTGEHSIAALPRFDFRSLPLCEASKSQLANIYDYVLKNGVLPNHKTKLLNDFILKNAYAPERGLYVPVTNDVVLPGKSPKFSERVAANFSIAHELAYFTNALAIPEGWDSNAFDPGDAPKPLERATNAGFLFVTIEHDCDTREEFEEHLAWTRSRDGKPSSTQFSAVDKRLCEFKDYRGYTIVFSGNRSLHFHFVFSIDHLKNCPPNVPLAQQGDVATTLGRAHATYWDSAACIVCETLGDSLEPDTKLRSIVQWRRLPWGIRKLEKDSKILDLPAGTIIPQLVLLEDVRTRMSTSASNYCVPESFSTAHPITRKEQSSGAQHSASSEMLAALRAECASEWGDYPYPTSIEQQQGQWLFKFKNHANDQNPSSLVLGGYRKLEIRGISSCPMI